METIVNEMSTSFTEVRDKFHNLFENSAVSSNALVGFGYFRRICTVHTWVNGTCWAASTDLVILIHGIVVPITSCICWSVPGSVVYSLLLFTFDFIQRLNSNFLQISGFWYISGNPAHEKSWAKILDKTHNSKLKTIPVFRLITIFRGSLAVTGGLRRDELLFSFGTVTTRSVLWRLLSFLVPTVRTLFFFPSRALSSTFMSGSHTWSRYQHKLHVTTCAGGRRCSPYMDTPGTRYLYEEFRKHHEHETHMTDIERRRDCGFLLWFG